MLSKAEVYCIIGRKIRPYLKSPDFANQLLFSESSTSELLALLRPALSRRVFDAEVRADPKKEKKDEPVERSESDEYALEVGQFKEVVK